MSPTSLPPPLLEATRASHHVYIVTPPYERALAAIVLSCFIGHMHAQGDVLEISAGTGRNLPYYRWDKLTSLTVTDSSRFMLFHARQKVAARVACSSRSAEERRKPNP